MKHLPVRGQLHIDVAVCRVGNERHTLCGAWEETWACEHLYTQAESDADMQQGGGAHQAPCSPFCLF